MEKLVLSILTRVKWKRRNKHNKTRIRNTTDIDNISVGKFTYGSLHVLIDGESTCKLVIGNCVSLGPQVLFLLETEHPLDNLFLYQIYLI